VKGIEWDLGLGDDKTFSFAAANDLHVRDAGSVAIVNHAVKRINAEPGVQFTVVLGDLATDGKLSELRMARKALDRLEKPCFAVSGNHDADPTCANPFLNYEKTFGERQWVREINGWTFIGLDSCEGTASDVSVPPNRIAWLQQRLKHIGKERPIGMFAHHPFNPATKQYRVANAEEVLALFGNHSLKLVAAGHYHGNQVEERKGVLFTTTACCSSTRGNFDDTAVKGYRLFRIKGETVTTEFVELQG
jgi:Icc protein